MSSSRRPVIRGSTKLIRSQTLALAAEADVGDLTRKGAPCGSRFSERTAFQRSAEARAVGEALLSDT
jgi:hypothetical protein